MFIQLIEEGESKGRKTKTVLFSYIYVCMVFIITKKPIYIYNGTVNFGKHQWMLMFLIYLNIFFSSFPKTSYHLLNKKMYLSAGKS